MTIKPRPGDVLQPPGPLPCRSSRAKAPLGAAPRQRRAHLHFLGVELLLLEVLTQDLAVVHLLLLGELAERVAPHRVVPRGHAQGAAALAGHTGEALAPGEVVDGHLVEANIFAAKLLLPLQDGGGCGGEGQRGAVWSGETPQGPRTPPARKGACLLPAAGRAGVGGPELALGDGSDATRPGPVNPHPPCSHWNAEQSQPHSRGGQSQPHTQGGQSQPHNREPGQGRPAPALTDEAAGAGGVDAVAAVGAVAVGDLVVRVGAGRGHVRILELPLEAVARHRVHLAAVCMGSRWPARTGGLCHQLPALAPAAAPRPCGGGRKPLTAFGGCQRRAGSPGRGSPG